jgi:hypothetical protein
VVIWMLGSDVKWGTEKERWRGVRPNGEKGKK